MMNNGGKLKKNIVLMILYFQEQLQHLQVLESKDARENLKKNRTEN